MAVKKVELWDSSEVVMWASKLDDVKVVPMVLLMECLWVELMVLGLVASKVAY